MPDSYQAINVIFIEMPILLSNERLIVPAASSCYPTFDARFDRYHLEYSERLTKTGKDCYESKRNLLTGRRMSTETEELAIQLAHEELGIHPRDSEAFADIFGRNEDESYALLWTKTGLRVPRGRDPKKYIIDKHGRKYWPRIALICSTEIGEVLVPEGGERVVPYTENPEEVWDLVLGIPRVTSDNLGQRHTTHWWFNPNPGIADRESGHYDVAVVRWSYPLHNEPERCMDISASYLRTSSDHDCSVRPVQGVMPRIHKKLIETRLHKRESALLDQLGMII